MMDAVSRFHKGRSALLGLAVLAAVLAACLPEPDEPIEYLQRPDSIIIQMRRVDLEQSEIERLLAVPDFTLYGDGTLLLREQREGEEYALVQANLSEEAVGDLLALIVDEGFLEFFYDQPVASEAADAPLTFIYVNTKDGANSVRILGLGAAQLEDVNGDLQRIERIVLRLEELTSAALGSAEAVAYVPEGVLLLAEPLDPADVVGMPDQWPLAADLSEFADSGQTEARVQGALVREITALLTPGAQFRRTFQQGDRYFNVGFRPILPFEENFPLFD
jgi:hypothetical protein